MEISLQLYVMDHIPRQEMGRFEPLRLFYAAGVWAGDVAYTSTRPLELTGGDLDEAIATMLDDPEAGDVSAFDRVASFKTGFFDGGSGTVASVEICR